VEQTTTPPTPVTRLIAKRNALTVLQIAFRTTEDGKYDQTKDEGRRRDNECYHMNFAEELS